jgi:hypothetical protein
MRLFVKHKLEPAQWRRRRDLASLILGVVAAYFAARPR